MARIRLGAPGGYQGLSPRAVARRLGRPFPAQSGRQQPVIPTLARIGRSTPNERRLLAEAVAALAVASFLVAAVPFRKLASLARLPDEIPPDPNEQANRIRAVRWAVTASARR